MTEHTHTPILSNSDSFMENSNEIWNIFYIEYTDSGLEVYNEDYFQKQLGLKSHVSTILNPSMNVSPIPSTPSTSDTSIETNTSPPQPIVRGGVSKEKDYESYSFPYRFFHYRMKFLSDSMSSLFKGNNPTFTNTTPLSPPPPPSLSPDQSSLISSSSSETIVQSSDSLSTPNTIKIQIEGELGKIETTKYRHLLELSKFYHYLWMNQKVITNSHLYVIDNRVIVLGKIENGEESIWTMFSREHSDWNIDLFIHTEAYKIIHL